jgi:hypothetical protein
MVGNLLIRGMLVGLVAGLLVFSFGKLFGEPQVDRAIAFETVMDEAKAKAEMANGMVMKLEPELVSREVQASIGLFTGVVVYCTAFGGLFALVFAFAYGRVGNMSPRDRRAARCGGHHRGLHRAEPEISGQSAVSRRAGDNRHTHRPLLPDDAE